MKADCLKKKKLGEGQLGKSESLRVKREVYKKISMGTGFDEKKNSWKNILLRDQGVLGGGEKEVQ